MLSAFETASVSELCTGERCVMLPYGVSGKTRLKDLPLRRLLRTTPARSRVRNKLAAEALALKMCTYTVLKFGLPCAKSGI